MPWITRERAVYWTALGFAIFQLFITVSISLYDMQLRALHVLMSLSVVFLALPLSKKADSTNRISLGSLLIVAIVLTANIRIFIDWEKIIMYPGDAGRIDLVLGAFLTVFILEASRRATGWAIPVLVCLMFVYVFLGPLMPGIWIHPGFTLEHVLSSLYYSSDGIYGSLTGTSATFISMFIIFGTLLDASGGGKTFIDVALLFAGRFKGGPAKVAVVSSALFGMISGSAVANVSVTGNYTIPLMKGLGYDPNFAGGVESISSTGGGITPPVMGITAFIMADLLGIPYLKIIGYAAIPCLLFYIGIIAGVHFEATRIRLIPVPADQIPHWKEVLTWNKIMPLIAPVCVLLVLLFRGYTLISAGFYACSTVIVLYISSDLTLSGLKQNVLKILKALCNGGLSIAKIAPILVSVGIFTDLLGLTGVAPKISSLILEMGGTNLIGSLLVAALIPLILGAPLPVTATYILSAALIAPAIVKLKIDVVAAHMFLLYWATLASVTPPTCTACVIGANIGGGNWFKVALVGMRLGAVAFLIPFFFVLNPALLGRGEPIDVIICAATGIIGAIFLAAGFFGSRDNIIKSVVKVAAGALMLAPNYTLSFLGIGMGGITLVYEKIFSEKQRAAKV
ncbi:MAG: TRAP transporter fused permease subunit [Desulfobacterales bacterium]|nr:TRAP transporter fused permease subunit [Desulfobacterales bacterium]